jgi:hypothetical protein
VITTLKEITAITGQSLQDELDHAIELRRRTLYLEGLKADYAALERDPKAMDEFQKEIELWDTASGDGQCHVVRLVSGLHI